MSFSGIEVVRNLAGKFAPLEPGQKVVVRAGTLVTGRLSGDRVLRDQAVLVEDGLIAAVGNWRLDAVPAGAEVIDASSATVLPGLIECHGHITGERHVNPHDTHLEAAQQTRVLRGLLDVWATMNGGFTTLFSMGHGNAEHVRAIKAAVNGEGLPGPRIYDCGWAISQSAGHGHVRDWNYELVKSVRPRSLFADGPYHLREVVRENIGCGADFVKLYAGEGGPHAPDHILRRVDFTDEEVQAIVDEAHRQGFRVAAHCMALAHSIHAATNGVDRVEHGPLLYESEFVPMLKETGAAWCPTLMQLRRALAGRDQLGLSSAVVARLEKSMDDRTRMIQEALDAGVTVGFGTDMRMRPMAGSNAVEFKLMVDRGIAPLDALSIGTLQAARMVGLDGQLGSVETGKLADLIVVDGDPAANIDVLTDPHRVTRILKSHRQVRPAAVGPRKPA